MQTYTNEGQPGDAEVRITRVSGDTEHPFRLYITDRISGATVTEVRMNAEQFADLLSNRAAEVTGTQWRGLDKVDKRARMQSERFHGLDSDNALAASELGARWEAEGWTVEVRKQNFGWTVIGRRWDEPEK